MPYLTTCVRRIPALQLASHDRKRLAQLVVGLKVAVNRQPVLLDFEVRIDAAGYELAVLALAALNRFSVWKVVTSNGKLDLRTIRHSEHTLHRAFSITPFS